MKKLIILIGFLALGGAGTHAQKSGIKETAAELNKLLGGGTVVSFKKEELVVEVYKNGKLIRRDRAYASDLDAGATAYNPEEWSVVLRCTEKSGKCVDKRLFEKGKQNQYTRLSILIKGNEGAKDELVAGFMKLILLCQE